MNGEGVVTFFESLRVAANDAVHKLSESTRQIGFDIVVLVHDLPDKILVLVVEAGQMTEVHEHRHVLLLPHSVRLQRVVRNRLVGLNVQEAAGVLGVRRVGGGEGEAWNRVRMERGTYLVRKLIRSFSI